MEINLALQAELNGLKNELQKAKARASISIGFSMVAFLVTGLLWVQHSSVPAPPPVAQVQPPTAAPASLSQNPILQSVTVDTLTVVDGNGLPVARIDGTGLTLFNGKEAQLISATGASSDFGAGYIKLFPANQGNSGTTLILPGLVDIDTSQNHSVFLGAYNSGPTAVGLDILNDHYTKSTAGDAPVDQTAVVVSPNNIALVDSVGTERVSIGQTPLTIPATGATSVTALSSMVLFDKSNHVSWETP